MILEEYIKQVKPYVEEMFKNLDSCHDIKHLERTMKIALSLCEIENGDRLIVGLSAYLHDIHRVIETEQGSYVSPKESLPKVKEILKNKSYLTRRLMDAFPKIEAIKQKIKENIKEL